MSNEDCLLCHSDKELKKEDSSGRSVSLFVDEELFRRSVHGTNLCVSCHSDLKAEHPDDNIAAQTVNCGGCHEEQSKSYGVSAHAVALREGNGGAALCRDCHGTHGILPPSLPASALHRTRLAATCGECHPEVVEEVRQSVHGEALARNVREAPSCLDCHFEHRIEPLKTASPLLIAQEVCSRCHASERMNTKFNLPTDRVTTFFASYHGLAVQFGSARAANCASCHGVHLILPSSDPRSMVNQKNLVQTCGKCHPGATANFAGGKVHVDDTKEADVGSFINRWVRRIYKGLIILVIGGMLVHNGLAWRVKALASLRAPGRTIERMNRSQRWQHFILVSSFIYLVFSGFALAYPESWVAWLMGANEAFRRNSHRVAGVILLLAGAYHIVYAAGTRDGRRLVKDFWLGKTDLAQVVANIRHFLNSNRPKPRMGRFGYPEKVEYWAVVWGTVIMGATGLVIWFKMDVTRFLPRWAVEVATTIHFYEAVLATLAICIWHFYHVIFDPGVYPMNWAAWDGRVNEKWYEEEHPADLETLRPSAQEASNGARHEVDQPDAADHDEADEAEHEVSRGDGI